MTVAFSAVKSPSVFKALAHDLRWKILLLLAQSDYRVSELERLLVQPQNVLSYHLRLLSDQHFVNERRSSADARDIYYSLALDTLRTHYFAAAEELHPALHTLTEEAPQKERSSSPPRKVRVLFLCTENSARSQMAEGILRHLSDGQVEVMSAGNQPTQLHPLAVRALAAMGIDISQQQPKHLNEIRQQSFDYIVTVCDRVRESCPTFPGDPKAVHWSFSDPAAAQGTEQERSRAFEQVALQLTNRIRFLLILIAREHGGTA
jgi:protein-tyrosine-phosphatase/DNA-binding transcriptional ArsR family regulator